MVDFILDDCYLIVHSIEARDSWKSDAGFFFSRRLILKATRVASECLGIGEIIRRDTAQGVAQTTFWACFGKRNRVGVVIEEMLCRPGSVDVLDIPLCEVAPVGVVVSSLVNDFTWNAPFVR